MLFKIFVMLAVLYTAHASTAIQKSDPIPEKYAKLSGCYLSKYDKIFGSEFKPIGECVAYSCRRNGNMQVATCGVISAPPGVELEEDLSLPYPDCCPKPK